MLAPGSIFAEDFRVLRKLSEGGMGAVYVAQQISTSKQRALKVMHASIGSDVRLRERFVQEAKVGARIDSEHVVEVVGAGLDPGSEMLWLAMELLEGEPLSARVERGPLPQEEVREIALQLRHALALAHAAGVVHRDLKPENVFLAKARRSDVPFTLKILDFGIAKVLGEIDASTAAVGSPMWMAPEQTARGGRVSAATDVWALGLIFFQLLTGRFYWRSLVGQPSVVELLQEILGGELAPASERAHELGGRAPPPGFDGWLSRCLCRDPSGRYPSAEPALTALVQILDVVASTRAAPAQTGRADPLPRAPHGRPAQRVRWIAAGVALTSVAAVAAVRLWPSAEKRRSSHAEVREIPAPHELRLDGEALQVGGAVVGRVESGLWTPLAAPVAAALRDVAPETVLALSLTEDARYDGLQAAVASVLGTRRDVTVFDGGRRDRKLALSAHVGEMGTPASPVLSVFIHPEGITLTTRAGNIAPGCLTPGAGIALPRAAGTLDLAGLTRCAGRVRESVKAPRPVVRLGATADVRALEVVDAARAMLQTEDGHDLFTDFALLPPGAPPPAVAPAPADLLPSAPSGAVPGGSAPSPPRPRHDAGPRQEPAAAPKDSGRGLKAPPPPPPSVAPSPWL